MISRLDSDYSIGDMIGKGNYARVHLAKKYTDGIQYAIKSLEKEKLKTNMRTLVRILKNSKLERLNE